MSAQRQPPIGRRTSVSDIVAALTEYAGTILKFSALVMLIATVYVLYGIFSGQLRAEVDPRIVANLRLVGQVLVASAGLSAVCLVIITYEDVAYAVFGGVIGLGYLFGIPFLIASNLYDATSPAAEQIAIWGTGAGKVIILVAGVRILRELYLQLTRERPKRAQAEKEEAPSTAPQAKRLRTIWLRTPCWQMPSCHEAIKEICPAYKAHKTCWRFGRGCNCDPTLVETLIRTGGVGAATDSAMRRRQQAYMRADLGADLPREAERTLACRDCAIYNEHQRAKFRFVNPVVVIATIIGLIAAYSPLMKLYELMITGMAQIAGQFTFTREINPDQWFVYLDTPTVRAFFVIILGLAVLAWVLKAVEWVILVKKI